MSHPKSPSHGSRKDAAVFRDIAQALGVGDPTRQPGEAQPLGVSDQAALDLWRKLRSAKARRAAFHARRELAEARIPARLRAGPKYAGLALTDEGAAEVSPWPAIVSDEPLTYGRRNMRPSPQELFDNYQASLSFPFDTDPREAYDDRRARHLAHFAAELAALAERVREQRQAERAAGLDENRCSVSAAALGDLESEILALPCDCDHALAAVAMMRLEHESDGESIYTNPNLGLWRAVLTGLRPRLTGEIAEDVAKALERGEGGGDLGE